MTEDKTLPWKIATGVFALLFLATLLNTGLFNGATVTGTAIQGQTEIDMTIYSDDVVKGSDSAPVTVILYSDPSCPFCAAAAGGTEMVAYMNQRSAGYEAAVPGIIKNYVDKGKVKFVYRFFPGHGSGVEAMKMMLCAEEQGKFWEVHDDFYNNQELMESGNVEGLANIVKKYVTDGVAFDACRASNKYDAKMAADTQRGVEAGIQGTPAFLVNGAEVSGAQPYSALKRVIDEALA
ncbi:DsbA family protein [Candidatus Woesearchaeota archaeon]|nr:DsbA family protein [Candidatus Woesearchaeota archaeon]